MSPRASAILLAVILLLMGLGIAVGTATPTVPSTVAWAPVTQTTGTARFVADDELHAPGYTSPGMAGLAAFVTEVALASILGVAITLSMRARRRALAEASLVPGAPLADGPSVVFGKVEGEIGGASPVTVRISQAGSEVQNKGVWSHTWREVGRTTEAHPFTLVRADGARVRVEPDESVVIHEKLVTFERLSLGARDRVAEIVPGADVHVTGVLSGVRGASASAYRGGPSEPVLRPPPRTEGPMVIADEPVGETDRERMRFHALAATCIAVALALTTASMWSYFTLVATGKAVQATPTATTTWRTWTSQKGGGGYWVTHYAIRARASDMPLEQTCGVAAYNLAKASAPVPFLVSRTTPSTYDIGSKATLRGAMAFVLVCIAAGALFAYYAMTRRTRPWYLRDKVIDRGAGRLGDTMVGV